MGTTSFVLKYIIKTKYKYDVCKVIEKCRTKSDLCVQNFQMFSQNVYLTAMNILIWDDA